MKYFLFLILMFFISEAGAAQELLKPDTCIDMNYYKSYYSYTVKGPVYCVYKIYKAGGPVSRRKYSFTGNLPHFNFRNSGYDKGHLVPAEDLAYCEAGIKSTFKYWNCLPQTARLNRGKWKVYENRVRKLSLSDSLLVITGGADFSSSGIPGCCWKFVYSLTTNRTVFFILLDQAGKEVKPSDEFLQEVQEIIK